MAKADTVQAIKAKFDTEVSEELTGKQLDTLLAAADKSAFDALLTEYSTNQGDGGQTSSDKPTGNVPEGKKRVRLGKKAAAGTSFLHPYDKVTIGKEPVLVTDDDWTAERIRHQELETA